MTDKKAGKIMKKARKGLDLTQAQVAEKVGISSNYYSMIERGTRKNPGSDVMARIAKLLKLKSSDIFPF